MSFISYGFCKHLGFTRLHLLLWYTLFRNCKLNSLASSIDKVYSLGLLKLLFIYFFSFCLFTFLLDVYPWISHFISLRSTVFKTREGKTKELLRSLPSLILSGFNYSVILIPNHLIHIFPNHSPSFAYHCHHHF